MASANLPTASTPWHNKRPHNIKQRVYVDCFSVTKLTIPASYSLFSCIYKVRLAIRSGALICYVRNSLVCFRVRMNNTWWRTTWAADPVLRLTTRRNDSPLTWFSVWFKWSIIKKAIHVFQSDMTYLTRSPQTSCAIPVQPANLVKKTCLTAFPRWFQNRARKDQISLDVPNWIVPIVGSTYLNEKMRGRRGLKLSSQNTERNVTKAKHNSK
jgi:hypothetical protein